MKNILNNILGISTLQDKVDSLLVIEKSISDLDTKLSSEIVNYKIFEKSIENQLMDSNIVERRNKVFSKYIDTVKDIKDKKDKLIKSKDSLLKSSPELEKAVQSTKSYQIIKSNFKKGDLSRDMYQEVIKAMTNSKVKYADCIILNENGEVLMLKRSSNSDFEPNKLGLPGGHVDPGEEPKEAAQRELKEETGLDAKNFKEEFVYTNDKVEIYYYTCELKDSTQEIVLEEDEHTNHEYIDINDCKEEDLLPNLITNLKSALKVEKGEISLFSNTFNRIKNILNKKVDVEEVETSQLEKSYNKLQNSVAIICKGYEMGMVNDQQFSKTIDGINEFFKSKISNNPNNYYDSSAKRWKTHLISKVSKEHSKKLNDENHYYSELTGKYESVPAGVKFGRDNSVSSKVGKKENVWGYIKTNKEKVKYVVFSNYTDSKGEKYSVLYNPHTDKYYRKLKDDSAIGEKELLGVNKQNLFSGVIHFNKDVVKRDLQEKDKAQYLDIMKRDKEERDLHQKKNNYSGLEFDHLDDDEKRKEADKLSKSLETIYEAYEANKISEEQLEVVIDKAHDIAILIDELGIDNSIEKAVDGFWIDDQSEWFEKADRSHLVKKEVIVTRDGKSFKQTVYINPREYDKVVETGIGEELSPTVNGMNIIKYSEKAMLITGDTYVHVDTLRSIKKEIGVGNWNNKLKGWVFPIKYVETVLGYVWSDLKDKGEDEKAQAVQNQKNSGLKEGDTASLQGIGVKIQENISNSDGIKYKAKLEDGTELDGVDEKVIDKTPETNDSKIAEETNNTSAEGRVSTEKKIYGIKPIEDIQNYSLEEYLLMHGLDQSDINKVLNSFKPKEKKTTTSSGGGGSKSYSAPNQIEGLTKRQLIAKLIYNHYQAMKQAIERGDELDPTKIVPYNDLMSQYSEKRQAMSEETKRKISEALKKNKEKEVEDAVKKLIESIPEKEMNKLKESFSDTKNDFIKKEKEKLAELIVEKEKYSEEAKKWWDKSREIDDYHEKSQASDKAREARRKGDSLDKEIKNQQNIVQVLENGGDLSSTSDKVGVKYDRIPNFTKIDTSNIDYDIDTILTAKKPIYIPEIDEDEFRQGGYIFDTIRVDENTYMLATNRHREQSQVRDGLSISEGEYDPKGGNYVVLTLDQLVLTQDYYTTKKKAEFKRDAERKNQRAIDHWDGLSDSVKEKYLAQKNMYKGLPVKVKKQVTEAKWESMTWQEREKYYKPIKTYGPERLKTKFDERHMASSFHSMYERFVNPDALRKDSSGKILKRGERSYRQSYAHAEAWQSWQSFREMLDWKINDINIQREELSEMRSKAIETSFGESNTNNILKDEYGILVKRQNGEDIKPQQITELKDAWNNVQESFGTLKNIADEDNLKLSHTGNKHIFASKAIGVYVSKFKTIGVTAKLGQDQLSFTMGHEVAHWIDNKIGTNNGGRFGSDNYESTAGKIAILFRKNMNKESSSKYINATHECFARAMEQYHAIETQGKNAVVYGKDEFIGSDNFVSLDTYEKQLKPLVEQFLQENKELLKSIDFSFNEDLEEINKAFQGAQIGEQRKHSDGKTYKKVASTGKPSDWQLVTNKKDGKQEDTKTKAPSTEELKGHAKEATEAELISATKNSPDENARKVAHEELDRRSKEEVVQEEEQVDGKKETDKESNKEDDSKKKEKKVEEKKEKKVEFSEKQKEAIKFYTEKSYNALNTRLRKNMELPDKLKEVVTQLDSSFSPTTKEMNLYRGVTLSDDKEIKKLKNIKVGDTYEDKAYISTSKDIDQADNFNFDDDAGYTFEIKVPKGKNVLDVGNMGEKMEYEKEVLLPKDSKFKVTGKKGNVISLELQ